MVDIEDLEKLTNYLNEYYGGEVDYRHGKFLLNGISVNLDTIAGVNFIKWLARNDKVDMNKFKGGILCLVVEYYKGKDELLEFLATILK